eukprot:scaffold7038_cov101-Isochrysis_galbana.AAC.1
MLHPPPLSLTRRSARRKRRFSAPASDRAALMPPIGAASTPRAPGAPRNRTGSRDCRCLVPPRPQPASRHPRSPIGRRPSEAGVRKLPSRPAYGRAPGCRRRSRGRR